ncbi:MAG: hypothetical protein ACI8VE_001752 [Natrialbaceae archaeon]
MRERTPEATRAEKGRAEDSFIEVDGEAVQQDGTFRFEE